MLRLSLNVASTRVVLLEGHTGAGAAGKVIESFGHFLIGGNFAVGLIVFAILVVINFVVVTKGAERIAEVGARFTLDAMPGKQMAIDADLNAGLIDEKEAKRRRAEVGDEAEFFGSMDGASKFVRGDAMAGLLILFINIIGGFVIGVVQHDLSAAQAADSYILLAVGDALVAQIPALLISVAAAMVVSRVGKEHDVGSQITKQVFSLAALARASSPACSPCSALIPGMPHLVFLLHRRRPRLRRRGACTSAQQRAENAPQAAAGAARGQRRGDLGRPAAGRHARPRGRLPADRAGRQGAPGRPARRASRACARKFAQDVGFLPPPVHIRDNLELKPSAYRLTLRGAVVGEGEAYPGHAGWRSTRAARPTPLIGTATTDPAFGLPATWIEERQREAAPDGRIYGR